jgi:hypothetical protein
LVFVEVKLGVLVEALVRVAVIVGVLVLVAVEVDVIVGVLVFVGVKVKVAVLLVPQLPGTGVRFKLAIHMETGAPDQDVAVKVPFV